LIAARGRTVAQLAAATVPAAELDPALTMLTDQTGTQKVVAPASRQPYRRRPGA
jgi:hypothetical protein